MEDGSKKNLLTQAGISKFIAFTMIATVIAASVLIISVPKELKTGRMDYMVPGQKVQYDIFLTTGFITENYADTERKQNVLKENYPYFYEKDDNTMEKMTSDVKTLLDEIMLRYNASLNGTAYPAGEPSEENGLVVEKVKNIDEEAFKEICLFLRNENQRDNFLRDAGEVINGGIMTGSEKETLPKDAAIILSDSLGRQTRCEEGIPTPAAAAQKLAAKLSVDYDKTQKDACEKVFSDAFNMIFKDGSIRRCDAKRDACMAADLAEIKPEMREYFKGDLLFEKGHVLTDCDIKTLQAYEKAQNAENLAATKLHKIVSSIALCLAMMVFICIYIYNVHPEVTRDNRAILLLVVITVLALLADRVFTVMFRDIALHFSIPPQFMFLALPLGFAALVTSVMLGLRTAIYVGLFVSSVTAVAMWHSFPAIVTGLLVSGIAGTAVRHVSDYKKFFVRAFFSCTFTNFFLGMVLIDCSKTSYLTVLENCAGLSVFCGMCTAILAILVLFALDSLFSGSTNMAYLTMTDRNDPLLKRLLMEAPGTYHHSERVATIGENAAIKIGANPLKVQACALFHDVGKLSAPEEFTENSGGGNLLADHTPEEAADIIRQHVSYGLELARRYKLREPLRRVIAVHHGTDFISFLYEKAKEMYGDKVKKEDFRYPGPLPVDKEEVIIALADCCEAALKSKPNPTREDIQNTVNELFKRKLLSGQLSAANITIAELSEIKLSFIETLTAMSNVRLAYSTKENETQEIEL